VQQVQPRISAAKHARTQRAAEPPSSRREKPCWEDGSSEVREPRRDRFQGEVRKVGRCGDGLEVREDAPTFDRPAPAREVGGYSSDGLFFFFWLFCIAVPFFIYWYDA